MTHFSDPVLEAMATRRSVKKVGPQTPTDDELARLLAAVTPADHKSLRPWRFILLRGEDRIRLGGALDAAAGVVRDPGQVNGKALRAELLIAVVASPTEHSSVPEWEQHATAAGAGHLLELALWQSGWGAMWRSGSAVNAPEVRAVHGLTDAEHLMGWLYVGNMDESFRTHLLQEGRPEPDTGRFLSRLPS